MPQDPPAGMGALCDCTVGDAMNCVESGRKCKCNTNMGYVLKEYDTLQSAADGNQYMKICVKETPCDKHVDGDGNSLCTENSRCVENGDTASCVCTDDTYEADPDWTGEANGKCIKIDPCKSYSCDAIANSKCTGNEVAQCMCSTTDFQAYKKSGDDYAELSDATFDKSDDVKCVAKLPCNQDPCGDDANMTCKVETEAGLPVAYCQCEAGYGDANDDDNKAVAGDGMALVCSDINECETGDHNCQASEECENNTGSYTCTCKENFLANTGDNAAAVPCVACSGPGATESAGTCTCTDPNAALNAEGTACECNIRYEDKDGTCTAIVYTSVLDIPCEFVGLECGDLGALCSCEADGGKCKDGTTGKCVCRTDQRYFSKTLDTAKEQTSGAGTFNLLTVCEFLSECDEWGGDDKCTINSVCQATAGADGGPGCVCKDEDHEEDPDYAAKDGAIANGECRRIDPCNTYSCDAIANSECTGSEVAQCMCSTGLQACKKSGDNYAEFTDSATFDKDDDVKCVAKLPCAVDPCT